MSSKYQSNWYGTERSTTTGSTTCDRNTCGEQCVETVVFNEFHPSTEEFVTSVRHKKCKVVQLVRGQMEKLANAQLGWLSVVGEVYGGHETDLQGFARPAEVHNKMEPKLLTNVHPRQALTRDAWPRRALSRIRQRMSLILAGVVLGVLVWTSLVYGAILGASLCGNSRPCFTSFKYTRVRHSLF